MRTKAAATCYLLLTLSSELSNKLPPLHYNMYYLVPFNDERINNVINSPPPFLSSISIGALQQQQQQQNWSYHRHRRRPHSLRPSFSCSISTTMPPLPPPRSRQYNATSNIKRRQASGAVPSNIKYGHPNKNSSYPRVNRSPHSTLYMPFWQLCKWLTQ